MVSSFRDRCQFMTGESSCLVSSALSSLMGLYYCQDEEFVRRGVALCYER